MRYGYLNVTRPTVLLAVLLFHGLLVYLSLQATGAKVSVLAALSDPFIVFFPPQADVTPRRSDLRPPDPLNKAASGERKVPPRSTAENLASPGPEDLNPSTIDWLNEQKTAASNAVARREREAAYRNLAGLSAQQLGWIKENRMTPAPPGIKWNRPRLSVEEGIPVFRLNDHCVLVLLIPFCKIGHIEPNGDLFKHMRDSVEP